MLLLHLQLRSRCCDGRADLLSAYGKQHTDIKERQCTFMTNLPSSSKPADHATVKFALKQAGGLSL